MSRKWKKEKYVNIMFKFSIRNITTGIIEFMELIITPRKFDYHRNLDSKTDCT